MQAQPSLDAATGSFARTATWVGAVPALLVGVVLAVLVHPLVGLAAFVLVTVAWVVAVRSRLASAADRAVAGLDAAPMRPEEHPRLANVLDGLGATSGVTEPTVLLVRSDSVNAMVAASAERVELVLTTGLVDQLGRLELEGVLANLLGPRPCSGCSGPPHVRTGSCRSTSAISGR